MKILIADDDGAVRQSIRRALARDVNADFAEAANGLEVLDALTRSRFDLVLLDIEMGSLEGTEILEAIRNNTDTASLPVVMISGAASVDRVTKIRQLGVSEFLAKPLSLGLIKERLVPLVTQLAAPEAGGRRRLTGHAPVEFRVCREVVLAGGTAADWEPLARRLSPACHVVHFLNQSDALRDVQRRRPALLFVWSGMGGLLPAGLFARVVRREAEPHPPIILWGPSTALSTEERDLFDTTVQPGDTTMPGVVRVLRPFLTDASAAHLLLSQGSPVVDELLGRFRSVADSLSESPDTFRSGQAQVGPLFEARVPLQCGRAGWEIVAAVSPELAIRRACGVGNPDAVSHEEALEAVESIAMEFAAALSSALATHAVGLQAGRASVRTLVKADAAISPGWKDRVSSGVRHTEQRHGGRVEFALVPRLAGSGQEEPTTRAGRTFWSPDQPPRAPR